MFGPLTAADDDTDAQDTSGVADDTALGTDTPMPAMPSAALDALTAKYPDAGSIRASYEAAIQQLKAQRSGLSNREKLGALLIGFGQPTRHGDWREGVSNAAQMLLQQTMAAKKQDDLRQQLIAKYMADEGPKLLAGASTMAKLNAPGKPPNYTPSDETRFRMGIAKQYFPGVPEDQIVARNLMYDPKVNAAVLQQKGTISAVQGAGRIGDVIPPAPPLFSDWLIRARAVNPGMSDDELRSHYVQKYGGQ